MLFSGIMIFAQLPRFLCRATILLGFLGTALPLHAQRDTIDQWVESYMHDRKVSGLALAIVEGGRIVKAKGYGLANVEHNVPVTSSTVFESASMGKQFTAAAILLLMQGRKLKLDDPIAKYLPTSPKEWTGITIRHLLTHTSGIPDYDENRDSTLSLRLDYTEEDLLRRFVQYPLLFPPGEEWSYSNSGYVLLGMIIRAVTGEHWSGFLRKRVFEPLGMATARMISYDDIVLNRATGYRLLNDSLKNREVVGPGWNTTADGSLLLSLLDLAKWDAALYSNSLLSDSAKRQMWSPVRLNDGTFASYGFGWFLQNEPGRRAVEHGGDGWGFRTNIGRFLDDSLTVIVLANSEAANPLLVGHTVAALYRPALTPPKRKAIRLPPKALEEYAGEYKVVTGEVFHVSRSERGLNVALDDMQIGLVVPESKDSFFLEGKPDSRVLFVRDEHGRVQWAHLRRNPSWPVRAKKVK